MVAGIADINFDPDTQEATVRWQGEWANFGEKRRAICGPLKGQLAVGGKKEEVAALVTGLHVLGDKVPGRRQRPIVKLYERSNVDVARDIEARMVRRGRASSRPERAEVVVPGDVVRSRPWHPFCCDLFRWGKEDAHRALPRTVTIPSPAALFHASATQRCASVAEETTAPDMSTLM